MRDRRSREEQRARGGREGGTGRPRGGLGSAPRAEVPCQLRRPAPPRRHPQSPPGQHAPLNRWTTPQTVLGGPSRHRRRGRGGRTGPLTGCGVQSSPLPRVALRRDARPEVAIRGGPQPRARCRPHMFMNRPVAGGGRSRRRPGTRPRRVAALASQCDTDSLPRRPSARGPRAPRRRGFARGRGGRTFDELAVRGLGAVGGEAGAEEVARATAAGSRGQLREHEVVVGACAERVRDAGALVRELPLARGAGAPEHLAHCAAGAVPAPATPTAHPCAATKRGFGAPAEIEKSARARNGTKWGRKGEGWGGGGTRGG